MQVLVALPSTAFAHGEQALIPFVVDFVDLIVLIIVLILSKFTLAGKFILATIYLTTLALVNYWCFATLRYLDYINNMAPTNAAILLIPVIVLGVAYMLLRKRFTRT